MNMLQSLFDQTKGFYFTSIAGITNAIYPQYTSGSRCVYEKIMKIFSHYSLENYIFAGSIVGYVRNKEMPPWMDDLDIMIFEDQIDLFEGKIIPHLAASGFNVFKPHRNTKGGYHILSLQLAETRDAKISFSKEIEVKVPWAQVDVFYTTIDESNYIRNKDNWGLYHTKNIPINWVKPGRMINISGLDFTAFNEFEKDIYSEYGDVYNNLVVSTHDKTFLKIDHVPWWGIDYEYLKLITEKVNYLTPSVDRSMVSHYLPENNKEINPEPTETFDEILFSVITEKASVVNLYNFEHFYWCLDLKRILPNVTLNAIILRKEDVSVVTHLAHCFNKITSTSPEIVDLIEYQLKYLNIEKEF